MTGQGIEIIKEERRGRTVHTLYIDGGEKAFLSTEAGEVRITWMVYGPQGWPVAREMVKGILELTVLADELQIGVRKRTNKEAA